MNLQRSAAVALSTLACLASGLSAQVARGNVVDRSTGAPIRGAFVALLAPDGRRVSAVLTGDAGEFIFRAPAGNYSLRAERIGFQSATAGPFELTAEPRDAFRLQLEVAAFRLQEITVSTGSRCGRPEGSQQTAVVWEEARKALTVAAWVDENSTATFRVRHTERDLDLELREIRPPSFRFGSAAGKQAFRSWHPDTLERFGYIMNRGGDEWFAGPDAELLLSSSFLSHHCFKLERRPDRRGLLGLGFEPTRDRRLPDIQGVLWLDERSGELRFIEYGYTGEPLYSDRRFAGGRIEFQALANGAWIVSRWYIRAPRIATSGGRLDRTVVGTHETGGEVLDAHVLGGESTVLTARVPVAGIVFDSVRQRPLEGSRVYLSGTTFNATAGVAGRFVLDSIPAGEYFIAFNHPRLDSLPRYPQPQRLTVSASGVIDLKLATPSSETILDELCPPAELRRLSALTKDSSSTNRGIVFGEVTPADANSTLAGVEVGLTWHRYERGVLLSSGLGRVRPHSTATTLDVNGRYLICGVPTEHPVEIQLLLRSHPMQRDTLRLIPPAIVRRDFTVRREP